MHEVQFDIVRIAVAALINLAIGYLWFSRFVFGMAWMHHYKVSKSYLKEGVAGRIIYGFILSFVMAYVLMFFERHLQTSFSDGFIVGFLVWLGFVLPLQFSEVIWKKTAMSIFLINTGRQLLGLVLMGGILAY